MNNVVKISYGDETIFGHSFDAAVDFDKMTLSAEGKSYRIEITSQDSVCVYAQDPKNFDRADLINLNIELAKSIVFNYKKWLKEQDPVTLLMQEMGYFSVYEAAKKIRDVR